MWSLFRRNRNSITEIARRAEVHPATVICWLRGATSANVQKAALAVAVKLLREERERQAPETGVVA